MRALLYFAGLVISPIALYAFFFLGLVGLEEMSNIAIIPEGLARTFLILVGFGLFIWLTALIIFGLALKLEKFE